MRPWHPPEWAPFSGESTTACGWCEAPLDPKGPSLYFCKNSCQDQWMKKRGEDIPWTTTPADDAAMAERIRSRWGLPDPGKDVA